jgi:hypothetical protein
MKSGTRTDSALEGAGVDLNFVHLLCNLDYLGRLLLKEGITTFLEGRIRLHGQALKTACLQSLPGNV